MNDYFYKGLFLRSFDCLDELVIILDEAFNIVVFNKLAYHVFSIKDSVIGEDFFKLCAHYKVGFPIKKPLLKSSLVKNHQLSTTWTPSDRHVININAFLLVIDHKKYYLFNGLSATDFTINRTQIINNLIQHMPAYAYWKDKNLKYAGCNKAVSDFLGLPEPEAIIGKSDRDFNWSQQRIGKLQKADRLVLQGNDNVVEDEIPHRGGNISIMITSKTPLKDEYDEIIGILGISTDITEQKRIQKQLIKKTEQLRLARMEEERLKAMVSIGGMVAHELRSPLLSIGAGIKGIEKYLDELIAVYKKSSSQISNKFIKQQQLDTIKTVMTDIALSVKRSNNTINQLLHGLHNVMSFSQEALQPIDLKAIVLAAIEKYPFLPQERQLMVAKNLCCATIKGKDTLLINIIHNLLQNAFYAIKEVRKGGVAITMSKNDKYVFLSVKDTAKGISEDNRKKIFEPFFTTKEQGTSVGLGLYFCRLSIEKMKGMIHCLSQFGRYTTITMRFPLHN